MPIVSCKSKDGKPGYKVENTNGCPHTYEANNETSRKKAKQAAYKQWVAIEKDKESRGEKSEFEPVTPPENVIEVCSAGFLLMSSYGKGGEETYLLSLATAIREIKPLSLGQLCSLNTYLKRGPKEIGDVNYLLLGGDEALHWSNELL